MNHQMFARSFDILSEGQGELFMIDKLISDLSCVTGYLAVALLAIGIAIPALAFLIAGAVLTLIATGHIVFDWWPLGLSGGTA